MRTSDFANGQAKNKRFDRNVAFLHLLPVAIAERTKQFLDHASRTAACIALCASLSAPSFTLAASALPRPPQKLPPPQIDAEHALAEEAWQLVNHYFADITFHGTDWDAVHRELARTPLKSRRATYRTLRSVLSRLGDPYTRLLTPSDMEALRKYDVSGVGLLLTAGSQNELIVATDPAAGTSAASAGVKRGDVLIEVDGVPIEGRGAFEVAELMQGEDGQPLQLRFRDRGLVTLTRHLAVEEGPAAIAEIIEQKDGSRVGYIRLAEFRASGRGDVASAVDRLRNQGASAFILDLRGNPGGVFSGALEIAGIFEGSGMPVARVSSRVDSETYRSVVVGPGVNKDVAHAPLAVIIDERSASAAEVLAGGLRDSCRAAVVGDSGSFGKGLIQGVFGLSDGAGLVVTVASYETPKGAKIQGTGLRPDLPLSSSPLDRVLKGFGIYKLPHIDFDDVQKVTRECVTSL